MTTLLSWGAVFVFHLSGWVAMPGSALLLADLAALQVMVRRRAAVAADRAVRRRAELTRAVEAQERAVASERAAAREEQRAGRRPQRRFRRALG